MLCLRSFYGAPSQEDRFVDNDIVVLEKEWRDVAGGYSFGGPRRTKDLGVYITDPENLLKPLKHGPDIGGSRQIRGGFRYFQMAPEGEKRFLRRQFVSLGNASRNEGLR